MELTERIVRTIEGKEVDRVPTFSASLDDWPVQQVLGKPLIPARYLFLNPLSRLILNKWGIKLKKVLVDPFVAGGLLARIEAAVRLGFDSTWVIYEGTLMVWDAKTLARNTGSFLDLVDDGHGNMYFMYRGPALPTPEAFDAWPYLPDTDDMAQRAYDFFVKAVSKYSEKICLIGSVASGNHETLFHSVGFQHLPVQLKRNPDYVKRFVSYNEEYIMKTTMAMMDAGIKIIINGDDFAYKTGPMLNPKIVDELFGLPYTRLTKAVHDRGGKILIHSCGDNTKLFDYFIKWGFDGGHAYENTSNVDIAYEKKTHGDQFTIVGGVGVDYILTPRSTPDEVREELRRLIKLCAPGGRFIIGPVHDHPDMDMEKIRIMLEAAREYGTYPLSP
jgi:uroporphyrinogen decarboxylase